MLQYNLFLLSADERFAAREEFEAPTDPDAVEIAQAIGEACAEVYPQIELWQGPRHVSLSPRTGILAVKTRDDLQSSVLRLEETLYNARTAIAKSQRFLDQMEQARHA